MNSALPDLTSALQINCSNSQDPQQIVAAAWSWGASSTYISFNMNVSIQEASMAVTWEAFLRFCLCFLLMHHHMNVQAQENSSTKKLTIFSDYLENGFLNWSWGAHEIHQTKEVSEGQAALSF